MPNWIDEGGNNVFGKLMCKRCMEYFESVDGEVPEHVCCNGYIYKSESDSIYCHVPVLVKVVKKKVK